MRILAAGVAVLALAGHPGAVEIGEVRIDLLPESRDPRRVPDALEIREVPAVLDGGERTVRSRDHRFSRRQAREGRGEEVRHGLELAQELHPSFLSQHQKPHMQLML